MTYVTSKIYSIFLYCLVLSPFSQRLMSHVMDVDIHTPSALKACAHFKDNASTIKQKRSKGGNVWANLHNESITPQSGGELWIMFLHFFLKHILIRKTKAFYILSALKFQFDRINDRTIKRENIEMGFF